MGRLGDSWTEKTAEMVKRIREAIRDKAVCSHVTVHSASRIPYILDVPVY